MELSALLDAQRTYFRTGSTRSLAFRELMLDMHFVNSLNTDQEVARQA